MKIQCIDCRHCTATDKGFYCHKSKKYTMPFKSCSDKKNLEKQKKIDYYLTHYKSMKKTQIAKHFGWDVTHLNMFILQNFLPKRNDRTGQYEDLNTDVEEL
jgi:hypothetical protein